MFCLINLFAVVDVTTHSHSKSSTKLNLWNYIKLEANSIQQFQMELKQLNAHLSCYTTQFVTKKLKHNLNNFEIFAHDFYQYFYEQQFEYSQTCHKTMLGLWQHGQRTISLLVAKKRIKHFQFM